ncbi:Hypothetical_protein [Hexamita inflata]|uniref:Hypothetical_protein n=1 Tax=Hexamita inflata TaxID=28002 RepID=A0AA86ULW3_9EUKA|nr:Hypothetical protein HINF_LOCUS31968 [Hexamita inflata]
MSLERQVMQRLNIQVPNQKKTVQALGAIIQNFNNQKQTHMLRVSKLESEIARLKEEIQLNDEKIAFAKNQLNKGEPKDESVAEVNEDELQQIQLFKHTQLQLDMSHKLEMQSSTIQSQIEFDEAEFEQKQKSLNSIREQNEQLQNQIEQMEGNFRGELQEIIKILSGQNIQRPKSGRMSQIGFQRVDNNAQSLDAMIYQVNSGIDLILKQKQQLDMEEQVIDKKINRIKELIRQESM